MGAPEQPRSVSNRESAVNKRYKRCVQPSTTVKIGAAAVNKRGLTAGHAVNKRRVTVKPNRQQTVVSVTSITRTSITLVCVNPVFSKSPVASKKL